VSSAVSEGIGIIKDNLFEGFGTLVGITRNTPSGEPAVGHFFVVANLRPGVFYLLDPQVRFGTDSNGLRAYIESQQLNGDIVVLTTAVAHTPAEFESEYINYFLPDLITSECSISRGGRHKKHR
jgi:hypothetical protein